MTVEFVFRFTLWIDLWNEQNPKMETKLSKNWKILFHIDDHDIIDFTKKKKKKKQKFYCQATKKLILDFGAAVLDFEDIFIASFLFFLQNLLNVHGARFSSLIV